MKILLIDAGNSRIKWACSDDGRWSPVEQLPVDMAADLNFSGHAYDDVQQVWVSNVAGADVERHICAACAVQHWSPRFISSQAVQCEVHNSYLLPVQLGSDRWAALIFAWHHVGAACLVVNSGTATTIDALSNTGEFLGGLILPGLELMQRSLTDATAQLKMLGGHYDSFPRNTADALLSGAIQASCGAVQRQYALLSGEDAVVILSGGAARLLQSHLHMPVQMMDNLVLSGLLLIAQESSDV